MSALLDEADLIAAVLRGYPSSVARSDAERALRRIRLALETPPSTTPPMKCPHCTDGTMHENHEMRCNTCRGTLVNRAHLRANIAASAKEPGHG